METPQRTYTGKGNFKPDQLAEIASRAEIAIDLVRNSLANLELLDSVKDDLKTIKNKANSIELDKIKADIDFLKGKPSMETFLGLSNRISFMERKMSQPVVIKRHWWNDFLDYFKVNV